METQNEKMLITGTTHGKIRVWLSADSIITKYKWITNFGTWKLESYVLKAPFDRLLTHNAGCRANSLILKADDFPTFKLNCDLEGIEIVTTLSRRGKMPQYIWDMIKDLKLDNKSTANK